MFKKIICTYIFDKIYITIKKNSWKVNFYKEMLSKDTLCLDKTKNECGST